jgi:hypothetical protein
MSMTDNHEREAHAETLRNLKGWRMPPGEGEAINAALDAAIAALTREQREGVNLVVGEYGWKDPGGRDNKSLVDCTVELHARSLMYGNKDQHDGYLACREELMRRLEKQPRQEAPGAVGEVSEGWCGAMRAVRFYAPSGRQPLPGTKLYTTPPAPVDVRVAELIAADHEFDEATSEHAANWRNATPKQIERLAHATMRRRKALALLDGQPAGVDRG